MTKYLKFWGTRGSCPVSGPEYAHFGGNTICMELRYDDLLLIFDAGTGIRPLGLTLKNEKKIHLFLSHFHWDHIVGLPFFMPIYQKGVEVVIHSPRPDGKELIDQLFAKEFFPIHLDQIQAKLKFKMIEEETPLEIGKLTLSAYPTHHPGKTFSFKIKTPKEQISYITDNEVEIEKQKGFLAFHKGVDLFIHEAQYSQDEYEKKKGWGHSSFTQVAEMVRLIQPAKWLITHHDPKHSDRELHLFEKEVKALPCPAEWIADGHTIDLVPSHKNF